MSACYYIDLDPAPAAAEDTRAPAGPDFDGLYPNPMGLAIGLDSDRSDDDVRPPVAPPSSHVRPASQPTVADRLAAIKRKFGDVDSP